MENEKNKDLQTLETLVSDLQKHYSSIYLPSESIKITLSSNKKEPTRHRHQAESFILHQAPQLSTQNSANKLHTKIILSKQPFYK